MNRSSDVDFDLSGAREDALVPLEFKQSPQGYRNNGNV
jgi:hypothetical protein